MIKSTWGAWRIRAAALAVAVVVAVTAGAAPAGAHSVNFGWEDNHTICNGCTVSRGGIVAMWQLMLMSSVPNLGSCESFVDGVFGPRTEAATRTWQSNHSLSNDGKVGRNTWTKARSLMVWAESGFNYDRWTYGEGSGPLVDLMIAYPSGDWYFSPNFHGTTDYCGADEDGPFFPADH
jgi:hypothetical protein